MRPPQKSAFNLVTLPTPDPVALEYSQRLGRHIAQTLKNSGGWISFARYMELALYAPGLGYYSGGATKFGRAGDFITAPEISPLFGQTLAAQVAEIMAGSAAQVLEVGAGSGALAADLLLALEHVGQLPARYDILELSGELRERQRQTLLARTPTLFARVSWLDALPAAYSGAIIANELLDALPTHVVVWREDGIFERGVALSADGHFVWQDRPAADALLKAAAALPVVAPYVSEINLAARAWSAEWGRILATGALLLVDYGYPQQEYYHPQRDRGSLLCHYRHHAHEDPFWLPGLNDLTAHVDFTAVITAAHETGLDLYGYTSQAKFLFNCGITELLAQYPAEDAARYLPLSAGAQKLISPQEMGERFKVMAIGRGLQEPLLGFRRGDRSATL